MRKTLLGFLLALILATTMVWGQVVSGTLSGRITTATGEGVSNAAVTITNVDTGVSQRVLTGPDGTFSVAGLPAGTYRVDAEVAGFKRTSMQNVQLVPPTPVTVTITLVPGDIMETVEIMGTAPVIQTDNGEVSLGIPTRSVRELTILDRNFQQLAQLQPGVTPPTSTVPLAVDPAHNRFFSVNGQRPVINLWNMDGVNNYEPFRGTAIRVQPVESIQQMNLTTANYNAEKGFSGGLIEHNLTRAGTNQWHGSLFEFHSNNRLRSRPFFNHEPFDKPRFTYNQFGGTVGGRIIADRTFFFGSYEGNYNRGRTSVLTTVPTPEMLAGNFSGLPGVTIFDPATGNQFGEGRTPFEGNVIPEGRINPNAQAILSGLPQPNLGGFTNNFQFNPLRKNDWNKFDGRLDHRFADHTSAFLRYGYSNLHSIDESVMGSVLGTGSRTRVVAQNAIGNLTNTITPSFISELRLAYNRYRQLMNHNDDFAGTVLGPQFGLTPSLQSVNIVGLQAISNPLLFPMRAVNNNYNIVWTGSYRSSFHNLKFGTDLRQFRADGFFNPLQYGPLGSAIFHPGATMSPLVGGFGNLELGAYPNAFASFLVGAPGTIGAMQFTETPTIRQTWYGFHLSDTIQVGRRLSLDLGVRYDLFSPLEPRNDGGAMFYDANTNELLFGGIGSIPERGTQRDWDYRNVSPRISFAFQPIDRTVIRGGYAISYFQTPYQFTGWMPSAIAVGDGTNGSFGTASWENLVVPSSGFEGGYPERITAPNVPLNVIAGDTETPYVQTFSLQAQHEVFQGLMGSVAYVGALGRHLPMVQELNLGPAGSGVEGLPLFQRFGRTASTSLYTTGDNSNYHSFQAMLTKRFAQGLGFQGAYTFSRVKGYTFGNEGRLLNPFDRESNYGYLDWDRRHLLTLAHVWELPFGAGTNRWNQGWVGQVIGNWQINGIFTWASGTPLTLTADSLFAGQPNGVLFANPVGPVNVGPEGFSGQFVLPTPGTTFDRSSIRSSGYRNYDMSIFRSFPIMDRYKLEFRGEVYNISNTPRFVLPVTHIGTAGFGHQPTTLNGEFGRQFNLAARLIF